MFLTEQGYSYHIADEVEVAGLPNTAAATTEAAS
jgi:hypothetical protein